MPAFPDSSPSAVSPWSLLALMLLLVGLDLAGSIFAKEWSAARSPWLYVAGAASFVLLFSVFALGLRFAELSTVTFGWIVGVQAGVLVIERIRYDVHLPTGKWVAIVLIVGLQAYLMLAPSGSQDAREPQHQPQIELVPVD